MNGPEAFWKAVDSSNGPDACWPWTLSVDRAGYGQVRWVDGRTRKTHQVAYELTVGAIPEGLELDHVKARGCVQKRCCNPAHLEPVTNAENMARTALDKCGRGHPKTSENGRLRSGAKWRCVACELITQQQRREARRAGTR